MAGGRTGDLFFQVFLFVVLRSLLRYAPRSIGHLVYLYMYRFSTAVLFPVYASQTSTF